MFTSKLIMIGCLCFFTGSGWAGDNGENYKPSMSELLDKAAHKHPEAIQKIKTEYPAFIEYSDQQIQLINSGAQQPQISLGEDLLEMAKITGMGVLAAVLYSITHDLITTHIDFRYFSDLSLTHHGEYTKYNYPFVYHSESKILYALLWGTIATWWLGLPLGVLVALAARVGPSYKLGWYDLMPSVSILMLAHFLAAMSYGLMAYITTSDSFLTVESMHNLSYSLGPPAGFTLAVYAVYLRLKEAFPLIEDTPLRTECRGFSKTLTKLFKDNPNDPEIQALIRFREEALKNIPPFVLSWSKCAANIFRQTQDEQDERDIGYLLGCYFP